MGAEDLGEALPWSRGTDRVNKHPTTHGHAEDALTPRRFLKSTGRPLIQAEAGDFSGLTDARVHVGGHAQHQAAGERFVRGLPNFLQAAR